MHYAMILSAALACGCAGPAGGTDGMETEDGGRAPALHHPGPSEAALSLRQVWWSSSTALNAVVVLENRWSMPLSMSPSSFALDTAAGPRRATPTPDPAACAFGTVVRPGERGRCVLRFEGTGVPIGVRHRPSARATPIATCSATHRDGLCPPEQMCREARCVALCGPTAWDGACVEDAICAKGECRPRCSPEDPEGACAEGQCVRGECRTDCASIAWPDDACFACAWDAIELGGCEPGPDRCRACVDCPGEPQGEAGRYRYPTTCDCLERPSCEGCRDGATSFWRCVLDRCPACAE